MQRFFLFVACSLFLVISCTPTPVKIHRVVVIETVRVIEVPESTVVVLPEEPEPSPKAKSSYRDSEAEHIRKKAQEAFDKLQKKQ